MLLTGFKELDIRTKNISLSSEIRTEELRQVDLYKLNVCQMAENHYTSFLMG